MKRQISRSDFSTTFGFFMLTMKRTLGVTVLLCAFALLICPSYLLMMIHQILRDSRETVFAFDDTALATCIGTAVLSSVASVFYLFLNFDYLYTRKSSDFFHALPIKRSHLLLSRFFASIVPVLLPVFLVYGSLLAMLSLPYIQGNSAVILIGLCYNLLLLLLSTSLTLIFLLAASNTVDFLISLFTYHFGIIFLNVMIEELCSYYLRGFVVNTVFPFYWLNPILFGFNRMITDLETVVSSQKAAISFAPLWILSLSAAFLIVSLLLYRRRKSEKSGSGYAFRFVYSICFLFAGALGGFLIGRIFSPDPRALPYWIFSAIGAVLATIAYGAVLNRGFKTIRRSVLFGAISWVMVGALILSFSFDVYGFTARVPKKETIKYVQVSLGQMIETRFEETDAVLALHRKAIPKTDNSNSWDLQLHYVLTNGTEMRRDFDINLSNCMEEILALYKSEEHRKAIQKAADSYYGESIDLSFDKSGEESVSDLTDLSVTKSELMSLIDAYLSDLKHPTSESFLYGDDTLFISIFGMTNNRDYRDLTLVVESGFQNTRNVLTKLQNN